jgi:hypothetical protein
VRTIANGALAALCEPVNTIEIAATTTSYKTIADLLTLLWPSKDNAKVVPSGQPVITKILTFIVDQCQPWHTNDVSTALKLNHAKSLLKALHESLPRSSIAIAIIAFIQLGYVPEWWDSEIHFQSSEQKTQDSNCFGDQICTEAIDKLRLEVANSFSSLLITAVWHGTALTSKPDTCHRLLNQLRNSSPVCSSFTCSYIEKVKMGYPEHDEALAEACAERDNLRYLLETEKAEKHALEERLDQSEKLLGEERECTLVQQRYLEEAQNEYYAKVKELEDSENAYRDLMAEAGAKAKALEDSYDDYRELMADADRKVLEVENRHTEQDLMLRSDHCAREQELEDEIDGLRDELEQQKSIAQGLDVEKTKAEDSAAEKEAALQRCQSKVRRALRLPEPLANHSRRLTNFARRW